MKRCVIVGISGSGKSRVGRAIADRTGLTLHHMDSLIWAPHWTEVPAEDIRAALGRISAGESWIVEGWIDGYSIDLLRRAEVVLYVDYPGVLALRGVLRRWREHRGGRRPEMPEGCTESLDLRFLWTVLRRRERPHIDAILRGCQGLTILRSRSRQETERVIAGITREFAGSPVF